jgi:GxxExxY protein
MAEPSTELNTLTGQIVDAAFAVHAALGPGLLEAVYDRFLAFELQDRGVQVERQVALPVHYRGQTFQAGYRIDIIAGNQIVVEVKAVEKLMPVHEAQLLTYLKLSGRPLGLLINFNVVLIKYGIRRLIHSR